MGFLEAYEPVSPMPLRLSESATLPLKKRLRLESQSNSPEEMHRQDFKMEQKLDGKPAKSQRKQSNKKKRVAVKKGAQKKHKKDTNDNAKNPMHNPLDSPICQLEEPIKAALRRACYLLETRFKDKKVAYSGYAKLLDNSNKLDRVLCIVPPAEYRTEERAREFTNKVIEALREEDCGGIGEFSSEKYIVKKLLGESWRKEFQKLRLTFRAWDNKNTYVHATGNVDLSNAFYPLGTMVVVLKTAVQAYNIMRDKIGRNEAEALSFMAQQDSIEHFYIQDIVESSPFNELEPAIKASLLRACNEFERRFDGGKVAHDTKTKFLPGTNELDRVLYIKPPEEYSSPQKAHEFTTKVHDALWFESHRILGRSIRTEYIIKKLSSEGCVREFKDLPIGYKLKMTGIVDLSANDFPLGTMALILGTGVNAYRLMQAKIVRHEVEAPQVIMQDNAIQKAQVTQKKPLDDSGLEMFRPRLDDRVQVQSSYSRMFSLLEDNQAKHGENETVSAARKRVIAKVNNPKKEEIPATKKKLDNKIVEGQERRPQKAYFITEIGKNERGQKKSSNALKKLEWGMKY